MIKDKEIFKNWCVLIIALSVVFLFLIIRNSGLYPFVFPDEYTYSTFSRLIPFSDAKIPDYLYYAIYKVTKISGDGSLECARLLNAFFFILTAPFIYLICRDIAGDKVALLIAVCSVLGPINSYTAYFMPESLYCFVFWLFTYLLYRYRQDANWQRMMILGAALGLLSLVKPHALLLVPALIAYFLAVMFHSEKAPPISRIKVVVYFLVAALSVKLVLGFALAGINGLCFFGSSYTSGATNSISPISPISLTNLKSPTSPTSPTSPISPISPISPTGGKHSYLSFIGNAVLNLQGHILSLCLLFSVPVAYLVLCTCSYVMSPRNCRFDSIAIYTTLMSMNLLAVVTLYTATYAGAGPSDITTRLHARYYDFMFPLFLIVAATQSTLADSDFKLKWRVISALPVGAAILYATYTKMVPYFYTLTDFPELFGITSKPAGFYVICGLSLLCLAVWIHSVHFGAKLFLYLFVPAIVFVSNVNITKSMQQRRIPDLFDKAGMFTKHYLAREDLSKVLIIGSNQCLLFRSLLYLDNANATVETIPEGSAYHVSRLPEGKDWVLVIGDHPVPDDVFYKISMNGFTLVRARKPNKLSFKTDNLPGIISNLRGLSAPESYGRLSTGKEVVIAFYEPLPERFKFSMVAYALGPNVGRNFVISAGNATQEFTLGASSSERVLEIDNPERSNTIKLIVPQPVSPRELGMMSVEDRQLGVVLVEIRIDPVVQMP
jgi:phosphoglycerol transferase